MTATHKYERPIAPGSRRSPALVAVLAVLLNACSVSGISAVPDDIETPVGGWARGGDTGSVNAGWLATFGDPRLDDLVAESLVGNFFLEQERQRLESARQAVVVVRSARLPSVDLALDGSRRYAEDTAGNQVSVDTYDASLGARFDVDLWRRLGRAQQSAELSLAAQMARLESVERSVATETAARYFNVIEANQLLTVAEQRLANTVLSRNIVESGYLQGLNDALDLYLARNQVERERANLVLQEQNRQEAIAELQLSLARYPDGNLDIDGELPVPEEPIPTGLPSELLTRRPDVQEAWLILLAADADLAAAHKARFPSLALVGSTGTSSAEFSELLNGGATGWSLAFGLAQPLFDAGRLAALEEQALARVKIAEQAWLELVYRAFADVENAISRSASLDVRYEALLEAQENSTAALDLALDQYQRGLVAYTTVLESQRQAFDAVATVVQLRNQRLQNRLALFLALGGDFEARN